jgi:hypothetical protein
VTEGFIRWYRESGKDSVFSDQVAVFDRCGVSIAHPQTGVMAVINVDGDGVPVDFEMLSWVIGLRASSVTVNWWLSPVDNVVDVYWCEPLGCEVQTLRLGGLDREQAETVESAVMSAIDCVSTPTRGLVVDFEEATDADEWDSMILYDGAEFPGASDSLLLCPEVADRIISASWRLRGEAVGQGLTRIIVT